MVEIEYVEWCGQQIWTGEAEYPPETERARIKEKGRVWEDNRERNKVDRSVLAAWTRETRTGIVTGEIKDRVEGIGRIPQFQVELREINITRREGSVSFWTVINQASFNSKENTRPLQFGAWDETWEGEDFCRYHQQTLEGTPVFGKSETRKSGGD